MMSPLQQERGKMDEENVALGLQHYLKKQCASMQASRSRSRSRGRRRSRKRVDVDPRNRNKILRYE